MQHPLPSQNPADPPIISQPGSARRDRMRAIALLIVAVGFFSALDTVAKLLVTRWHLPVAEVVWLRFVGQTFYMIVIFGIVGLPGLLATNRLTLQAFRSVLMVMTTLCNFYALQTLRLDQTGLMEQAHPNII